MIAYIYFYVAQILLLTSVVLLDNRWASYVAVILAILFSGLRLSVGVDYESYLSLFPLLVDHSVGFYEPFTVIISKLLILYSSDVWIVFFVYAFFTILGLYYFFKKFSPNPELSFFLFLTIPVYYLATFNGVRQWCAISFFAVALCGLLQRKFFLMFLSLVAAAMFHGSALCAFILMPFLRSRHSIRSIVLISLAVLLIAPLFLYVLELTRYGIYLKSLRFSTSPSLIFLPYLVLLVTLPISLGYFGDRIKLTDESVILCNITFASILLLLVGYGLGIDFLTLMRANNYLLIALPVLVVIFIEKLQDRVKAFAFSFVVIFSLSYLAYTLLINGEKYKLVPYNAWNLIGTLYL